jgi:cell division septal protein FtsQ
VSRRPQRQRPWRRRAVAAGAIAAACAAAAWRWGPLALRNLPGTAVTRVEVVGTLYVAPDAVLDAAGIRPGRSVFDDFRDAEGRVALHPLVRSVRIRPRGWRTLRIEVEEYAPVALVGVPHLVPVMADGTILPLDPTRTRVDLPVVTVPAEADGDRLRPGPALELLRAYARIPQQDPGLAALVAEIRPAPGGGLALGLLDAERATEIWLPPEPDEAVLRRVRATLADLQRRRWTARRLEARYANLVVVERTATSTASG